MSTDTIDHFIENGWIIVDIPGAQILHDFAGLLEKKLQELSGANCSLSTLHEHVDEGNFKTIYRQLSEYFWEHEFSMNAAEVFLPMLKELIGLDIMVQYMPFLRIARPQFSQDNIGFHRDTQYGQTPYELAVHVPFVNLDDNAALRVISGSHLAPESDFVPIGGVTTEVTKGSTDHLLGKPYSPKQLAVPDGAQTTPLTMRVGQAAMFSPAIFHGQDVNSGKVTRVTTDLRFVSPNVDVKLKLGKVRAGYVPVHQSPVSQMAESYYKAQQDKMRKTG